MNCTSAAFKQEIAPGQRVLTYNPAINGTMRVINPLITRSNEELAPPKKEVNSYIYKQLYIHLLFIHDSKRKI